MKETVSLAARLFIITAVAALLLAVVNGYTSPIIAEREAIEYQEALKVAFEEADEFEEIDEGKLNKIKEENENIDDISIAKKGGEELGYVAKVIGTGGYGGDIIFVVGVEKENMSIVGYDILSSKETPGFGSKVAEEPFVSALMGKKMDKHLDKKDKPEGEYDIQAISGTTYSVNAILNGLNGTVDALQAIGQ